MTPLIIVILYLTLLLTLGLFSKRFFRGTSRDYFVASNSIGWTGSFSGAEAVSSLSP